MNFGTGDEGRFGTLEQGGDEGEEGDGLKIVGGKKN